MSITVKFFASLRESLDRGTSTVESTEVATVADVWRIATEGHELPSNTLIAINMEYADEKHSVSDGDEVAFFPPVTGG